MADKNKGGRPLKFPTVEILQEKIDDYFASCWRKKIDMFGNGIKDKETGEYVLEQYKPYTVSGMAVYLDTSRETLIDYENSVFNEDKDGELLRSFSDTIKNAKDKCYAYVEESLFIGKNPSGAIFSLKNNHGWTDVVKIDNTTRIIVGIEDEEI